MSQDPTTPATPRTDSEELDADIFTGSGFGEDSSQSAVVVPADFARQLERELATATADLATAKERVSEHSDCIVALRTALNGIAHPVTYKTEDIDPRVIARNALVMGLRVVPLTKLESALADTQRELKEAQAKLEEAEDRITDSVTTPEQMEQYRDDCAEYSRVMDDLRQKLTARTAELRAAEEDTRRLDWLEKTRSEIDTDGPGFVIYNESSGLGGGASSGSWKTIRAAIDAARAASSNETRAQPPAETKETT